MITNFFKGAYDFERLINGTDTDLVDYLSAKISIVNIPNKNKGVVAIINLEEPGEHPYCGDGIIPRTGFSYDPETFMNSGIQYYNLYWEDLTTPKHDKTIKICQIMHHIVVRGGSERKNKKGNS